MMKAQGIENAQSQASPPNPHDFKKNRFYALCSRGDQEEFPMSSLVCYKCSPLMYMIY